MPWIFFLCLAVTSLARPDGVAPDRLVRLSRGVNLSGWLWLPEGKTPEARRAYFTEADARVLHDAGLTHVRLPFDPERLYDRDAHALREDQARELDDAIAVCLSAGLAVIVDAHPHAAPWTVPDPGTHRMTELEAMWGALAPRLANTDPDRVFLELLNEPHAIDDPEVWPAAQEHLAVVVRAAAPRHTIIATGDEWGGIDGLVRLQKPLDDPNVVYSFHFYEPHTFTHQGATWGWEPWRYIKGLSYPITPEAAEKLASGIANEQAANAVRSYAREQWGPEKIRSRIAVAAAWGREHHVPVYCGEFGAYRAFSPAESRLAWLRDTAAALGDSKIGWAMWDYAGGFALVQGRPGDRAIDSGTAGAIGLREPKK